MYVKMGRREKNSTASAVAASVENGKGGFAGSGMGLCMWSKVSAGPCE
jgi:hypothetical protein